MTDKLTEICTTKREEVAARKALATVLWPNTTAEAQYA